jgi:hypothetical protein
MSGDSTVGTIVALSNADRSSLYVYRSFWNNTEKAQSAWSRFRLGTGAHICAAHFISGTLYVIVKRGSTVFLESLMITDLGEEVSAYQITPDNGRPWSVRLDRRVSLTGSYDSGTDLTTWTIPYLHESSLVGVLNDAWDSRGLTLLLSYPTTTLFDRDWYCLRYSRMFSKSATVILLQKSRFALDHSKARHFAEQ